MKKSYVTPTMVCEEFAANEYVAACGDENRVYKFVCDAGTKRSDWEEGYKVYGDDEKQYGFNYRPCGKTHEARTDGIFIKGWMDDRKTKKEEHIEVYIWRGPKNDNCHCTSNVTMDSWETDKS